MTPHARADGAAPGTPASAPFVMRDLCVELDGERILDRIDLTIPAGGYVALLGENGSGKTTLLRAMLGLVPVCCGEVTVHGRSINAFDEWRRLAYVPQRLLAASAVPVSVLEAVRAARIGPRRPRSSATSKDRAMSALDRMGLAHRAKHRLDSLSGGQQRRVMVARALATDADTLLLDEPTAGVDADSELRLADALADLHAEGKTVILVTHDLGEIAAPADQVVVLGGRGPRRVLYDGPPPPPQDIYAHVWHHSEDHAPPSLRPGMVSDL